MEFVNAFVFAADEVVALSVVAVAELFFWYRYDDMLFFDFFFFFFSFLTMFLLHREALRSRFHLKSLSVSRSGENIFSNFRSSSFPHFSTRRAEICAALSSSSSLARPPVLLPRFRLLRLLLRDDEDEMATTGTAAFIFFVPRL
jgi:hypothetical protein